MYKLLLVSFLFLKTATLIDISYYEVLGLSKQASTQEIKQAYKKLAIKLHPDKTSDSADQERFIKITEAYETLKDTEKRRQYDLYGSFDAYTKKYDYHSQTEYNNLFYNGLYHNDPFVETLSGRTFHSFLNEGFHFINFYSPFCPPCQNLVEHWKKLAEVYKGIIKVGAVNCKYHNSFCYNAMRIGSYPSLLFYPNGMDSNYVYYRGERTYEALEQFVMAYLNSRVHIPIVGFVKSKDRPMAYVLGANRIERAALTRIAYLLNGIVNVVIVEDENVREKLSKNEETTVVFKYNEINTEIESTDEKELLKNIVESLPKIDLIGPEKLKDIRNGLRSGSQTPWVIYFSKKGSDRLLLYQMRVTFPDMYFGEIDCDVWSELCASLQVERRPAWAVLKRGGAYQRAPAADPGHFVRTAAHATNLHSLSASDLTRILEGDAGTWVMLVVPYQMAWEHILDSFTQASFEYVGSDDISFGIVTCTASTDQLCRRLAPENAEVIVQTGRKRHAYRGQMDLQHLKEFLRLLIDGEDLELDEQQVLEILDPSGRSHSWLVAYLPAHCRLCDELAHQWRLVADKLRPLQFVRVGVLRCAGAGGFCGNVRAPAARLYPLASGQHYSVSLEHLSAAPYILEWALQHLDDSVQPLGWASFTKSVAADELRPTSGKKPWLIYFHSPRCYRCYEMYADFAIAAIHLHNAVNVGKVNCVTERGLCQHEQIGRYPALRLYLGRTPRQAFSSVVTLQVRDYASLLRDIKPHLKKYDESILDGIEDLGIRGQGFHIKHDEF